MRILLILDGALTTFLADDVQSLGNISGVFYDLGVANRNEWHHIFMRWIALPASREQVVEPASDSVHY